jgi:hypothetical protein
LVGHEASLVPTVPQETLVAKGYLVGRLVLPHLQAGVCEVNPDAIFITAWLILLTIFLNFIPLNWLMFVPVILCWSAISFALAFWIAAVIDDMKRDD